MTRGSARRGGGPSAGGCGPRTAAAAGGASARAPAVRDRGAGFTLLELLAVLALLGILCAVAVPSLGRMGGAPRLGEEVERLRLALLEARASAIAEGADHRFVLEGGRGYRVEASGPGGWSLRESRALPPGFRLTVDGASAATLTFLPRGAVDAPGTLLLRIDDASRRLRLLPGGLVRGDRGDP